MKTINFLLLLISLSGYAFGQGTSLDEIHKQLLINNETEWKYHAKTKDVPHQWKEITFDDSQWSTGKASIGYGDEDDVTELNKMYGSFDKVYLRTTFTIANKKTPLHLYMYFDDAFIAYINGVEVARSGIDSQGNISATGDPIIDRFSIKLPKTNSNNYTLAIVGFNHHLKSSDFSLLPWLGTTYLNSSSRRWMATPYTLTKQQAQEDIKQLKFYLDDRASYFTSRKQLINTGLDELATTLSEQVAIQTFAAKINQQVLKMVDCHYRMSPNPLLIENKGNLPFRLARTNIGWVAFDKSKNSLLNKDYPLIEKINGIPFSHYIKQAKSHVNACSKQMVADSVVSVLQKQFPLIHREIDKNEFNNQEIKITLAGTKYNDKKQLTLSLTKRPLKRIKIDYPSSTLLAGDIGYLRINSMNSDTAPLHKAMTEFKDSKGLIIDIRNNGGGTYDILDALYGYFLPPGHIGNIVNVAAIKNSQAFARDHLDYRSTYVAGSAHWSKSEKLLINNFKSGFTPMWLFPREAYSDWHYRIVKPLTDKQYFYDKPIIVLTNAGSASASDGFASAFKQLPQVTLLGEASAGMSGANRPVVLANSRLRLNLSSMLSFRPNGKLFEGNGVPVNIKQLPNYKDYISEQDSVLTAAQTLLK
ncbi:S41 family peptidase [Colwellia psychrerythraea]|uniref:Peptidase S41 n=1 Tax=Colwellia psychrerythraea TaxID=28229 RepID=A0A099KFC2_COLPS|nr:S41 family peptidase [Colwellia psychrerythraea]KGJ88323.1 peptidase S41 [Colwellia psychrerythraea]